MLNRGRTGARSVRRSLDMRSRVFYMQQLCDQTALTSPLAPLPPSATAECWLRGLPIGRVQCYALISGGLAVAVNRFSLRRSFRKVERVLETAQEEAASASDAVSKPMKGAGLAGARANLKLSSSIRIRHRANCRCRQPGWGGDDLEVGRGAVVPSMSPCSFGHQDAG
jgi:hypothetical protein